MVSSNLAEKLEDRFTYGQYCEWDDGERWELIDGVPYNMTAAPLRRHQGISTAVISRISEFLRGKPSTLYCTSSYRAGTQVPRHPSLPSAVLPRIRGTRIPA